MSPGVNNGFIRSPGKTPGVGGISTSGEGGWDPREIATAGKNCRESLRKNNHKGWEAQQSGISHSSECIPSLKGDNDELDCRLKEG